MFGDNPPRWLRWADTSGARATTTLIALVALISSLLLGLRQQAYINCVAEEQAKAAERTRALATATDAERVADRDLIAGVPGETPESLRAAAVAAREVTDRVREANPPAPLRRC